MMLAVRAVGGVVVALDLLDEVEHRLGIERAFGQDHL